MVHNDDVHKGNLNARLIFTPVRSDAYSFVVTSYQKGALGKYTLKVQEVVPVGPPVAIKDNLSKSDKAKEGKLHKSHLIPLEADKPCTIVMKSPGFDVQLGLYDPAGKNLLAEASPMTSPGDGYLMRLDFTPVESATYNLVVTATRPGETGAYNLRLQKYRQP